jgi:glycosyltransferase involved in cell wall biosynthesis
MVPAQAELVALCDHDDRWYPDKLAALREAIVSAELAYSDVRRVDADGNVRHETLWEGRRNNHTNLASLLISNTIVGASCLFRRRVIDHAVPFPAGPGWDFHDHWLALVAMALGDVAYVDRPLYDYVQHGGAARGHEAAMRSYDPRRRLRWRDPRGTLAELSAHAERAYEVNARRIASSAREIEARAGELEPEKARVLRRLARLDTKRPPAGWLALRSLRRLRGHNETMGIELSLLAAVLWRR